VNVPLCGGLGTVSVVVFAPTVNLICPGAVVELEPSVKMLTPVPLRTTLGVEALEFRDNPVLAIVPVVEKPPDPAVMVPDPDCVMFPELTLIAAPAPLDEKVAAVPVLVAENVAPAAEPLLTKEALLLVDELAEIPVGVAQESPLAPQVKTCDVLVPLLEGSVQVIEELGFAAGTLKLT
jgi:hypothetical protein